MATYVWVNSVVGGEGINVLVVVADSEEEARNMVYEREGKESTAGMQVTWFEPDVVESLNQYLIELERV